MLRFCHVIMGVGHHAKKVADILAGNAVVGSSQCFSDQRFAIYCLSRGDGDVRASLFQKIQRALVPWVIGHLCAMPMCLHSKGRVVQKAPLLRSCGYPVYTRLSARRTDPSTSIHYTLNGKASGLVWRIQTVFF